MGGLRLILSVLLIMWLALSNVPSGRAEDVPARPAEVHTSTQSKEFTGSVSCRECHEKFYQLWSTSRHGLAMQPYSKEFARTQLTPQADEIVIGSYRYRPDIGAGNGWVRESGPDGNKKYPIAHAMGGKNVYYFLTPMERGRLQVLPVAYDVRKKEWFDTTASMMRHFADQPDEAVNWEDRLLTFNTSCYGCHVSQLATNYDLKTDTYHTVWSEPGINCETCHGSAGEHIRVCREAPEGETPKDLKMIRGGRDFTAAQQNSSCAPCHAKMMPLTTDFQPGDRHFDHFGLATLEDPDFYPDGRDLGENFTYTLWLTSPCIKSGELDCLHCHTSSGRYRFKAEEANNACMPCHKERVENAIAHTRHAADSEGNKCISCHMPMTEFARMRRSDHSMRPPTPSTTIAYKSPNACNLCHTDQDASWSDTWVRKWRARDYQTPVLHRAALIDAARTQDWTRLIEMLSYLTREDRDEVYATSLIRLLRACDAEQKWPVIIRLLNDPSPLVRASAAEALTGYLIPEAVAALLTATRDDYRLVRVRAAATLAGLPREMLKEEDLKDLDRAVAEFKTAMQSRPDDATSHYNLGNFYMNRNEPKRAAASYETAIRLQPDSIPPLVNVAFAYDIMGQNDKAQESLREALRLEPENAAANLNLGLLLGEQGRKDEAKTSLRRVLKADPNSAVAAYNLGVLLADDHMDEAITWCGKAYELRPRNPKYAYTLAFYQRQKGDTEGAIEILQAAIERQSAYIDAYLLLADIYEKKGKAEEAESVYRKALAIEGLSSRDRYGLEQRLRELSIPEKLD